MRPLKLHLHGFSTFVEPTEIDFSDVELLALVGPTGAGKSSIIDGITFALFGSVARYDEKAVGPVIHQRSAEARVRLDFEIGGVAYSAVRVVRRTKAGGGTTKEARLERGADVLADDAKSLTEAVRSLLGLDFAQFNKTVVLPQGRFAEFLHDKPRDRGELLRDLLGLGMYARVGAQARELAKSHNDRAAALEQSLATISDVTPQDLKDLKARAKAITTAQRAVAAATPTLADLELQQRTAEARLDVVTAQISAARSVMVPDGVAELDDQLRECAAALKAAEVQLVAAHEAVVIAEAAAGQRRTVAECDRLLDLHTRHAQSVADHEQAVEARDACAVTLATATERAAATRSQIVARQEELRALRAEVEGLEAELRGLGERGAVVAVIDDYRSLDELGPFVAAAEQAAALAHDEFERADAACSAATAEFAEAERLVPAVALAEALRVGEHCPVCQQAVHELPEPHGDSGAHLDALRGALAARTAERRAADAARREADTKLTTARTQRDSVADRLRAQPALGELEERLAKIDDLATRLGDARVAHGVCETALADLEADSETRSVLADEQRAASELMAAEAVLKKCAADRDTCAAAVIDQPTTEELESERVVAIQLADGLTAARTAERVATRLRSEAEVAAKALDEKEQSEREHFEETRDAVAALNPPRAEKRLADAWKQLSEWAAQQVVDLLATADSLRTAAATARDEHAAVFGSLRQQVDPVLDEQAKTVAQLDKLLAAAEASTKAKTAQVTAELARIEQTQASIDAMREDAQVAQLLGNVLKADRFERWLLEEAVEELVARATVRLQELTHGQYSIVANDGAFEIVDHRNADEARDVRSLSGGETFLASLCLALALADSTMELAADGAAPLESIFLDEGFGSLDPDTLDIVAGSIEELGATGRMVGIVTHIRELGERMPTRFEVSKGASGSTVTRVDA